jgi:hypothetical protein
VHHGVTRAWQRRRSQGVRSRTLPTYPRPVLLARPRVWGPWGREVVRIEICVNGPRKRGRKRLPGCHPTQMQSVVCLRKGVLCSEPDAVQRRVCTRSGRVKALCNSRLKDVLLFSDIAPHRSQASVVALPLPSSKLHTSSHTPKRFTPTHSRLNCPSAPPIPTHDPRLPPRTTHHGDSTALQREQQDDVL